MREFDDAFYTCIIILNVFHGLSLFFERNDLDSSFKMFKLYLQLMFCQWLMVMVSFIFKSSMICEFIHIYTRSNDENICKENRRDDSSDESDEEDDTYSAGVRYRKNMRYDSYKNMM